MHAGWGIFVSNYVFSMHFPIETFFVSNDGYNKKNLASDGMYYK